MYKELELDQLDEKLKEYTIENPDEPGEVRRKCFVLGFF